MHTPLHCQRSPFSYIHVFEIKKKSSKAQEQYVRDALEKRKTPYMNVT